MLKWNKSDRESQILLWFHPYVEHKNKTKQNKWTNLTKKPKHTDTKHTAVVTRGECGGGWKWEETIRDVRGKPEESGIELAKKFYQVFHNILWKNLNKFFDQPNIVEERHEGVAHSFSFLKIEITLVYKLHVYNTIFPLYTACSPPNI